MCRDLRLTEHIDRKYVAEPIVLRDLLRTQDVRVRILYRLERKISLQPWQCIIQRCRLLSN